MGLLGIGIKAGVNVSSLSNSDWSVDGGSIGGMAGKAKTGYYVGLYREFRIFNFAIQPEVVYSRHGNRYKIDYLKIRNKLNYLNIPVMLKYRFTKGFSVDF